jgi:hypothetical protein
MSGGAFGYFYYKIDDDLARHLQTLAEMLQAMDADPSRYDPEATQILRKFGSHLTEVKELAQRLSTLMHDVEWVASYDYGPQTITEEVEKLKQDNDWWGQFNPNRHPQGLG